MNSFYNCTSLSSVTIPELVDYIELEAFSGCSSLSAITFESETPPIVYDGAFADVSSTGNITVPVGYEVDYYPIALGIGENWTVNGQTPVRYVDFEDPLVEEKCVQLYSSDGIGCTEEDLGEVTALTASDWSGTSITEFDELGYFTGLTAIPDYTFYGCTDLTKVIIPGTAWSIGNHAFEGCTSLETVAINDGVAVIYSNAFAGCTALESIDIHTSVQQINGALAGQGAFYGCSSLSRIIFDASTPPATIGSAAFEGVSSTGDLTVPDGDESNYFSLAQTIGSDWTVNEQTPS